MKYAITQENGRFLICSDSEVELPDGAIYLSEDDYDAIAAGTKTIVDGVVVLYARPSL